MDRAEIRLLFNYLDINQEQLNRLQNEFILSLKNQYKLTGLLTPGQIDKLVIIKEKVYSLKNNHSPEPDFASSMYSQLPEFSYLN
jgi:hypothetical protein